MHTLPSGWLINLVGNTGFFRRTVMKVSLGKDLLEAGQAVLLHCVNQLSTLAAEAYARYSRRAQETERSVR